MMRVLIAAGGTAGHINPGLAIAEGIRGHWPNAEIHFAGRKSGMENNLVSAAGYPFHPIEVQGIQRSVSPRNFVRNVKALWHLAFANNAAVKILRGVRPDLVIGTGGYVSGPMLLAAAKKGISTAIHEQNAYPGVTNRLLAKHVDIVFAPTQSAVERLGQPQKALVTGNPVRPELFTQSRQAARESIGASENQVVLLSFGGSLGARFVNFCVGQLAQWHLRNRDFLHIHATGKIEKENFAGMAKELGIDNSPNFIIKEYIQDMPAMLAAADLVLCRAGALTLAELAAVGRASILIPSPNVAENHQYYNALEFEEAVAGKVFEEKKLSENLLIATVDELTKEPNTLLTMGNNAKKLASPKALEEIVGALVNLMEKS